MIEVLALAIVMATGAFLAALGGAALFSPSHARRFLLGFADSPSKHYTELGLRFLAACAFVLAAPSVLVPTVFIIFGWVLLATTAGLLLIPWRWHHRFARRAVPEALRFLPVVGASSVALGILVLMAVYRGNVA